LVALKLIDTIEDDNAQEGHAMKRIVLLVLLSATLVGCATPVYTAKERDRQISRNWHWELLQITDDVDHALLLRPMGHLTVWELR
jgi:hypothetical protein